MSDKTNILIITKSWEPSADKVIRALTRMGAPWVRFNTTDLPKQAHIVMDPTSVAKTQLVSGSGKVISLDTVKSAWLWKHGEYAFPPNLHQSYRLYAENGFHDGMAGIYELLEEHTFVVSPNVLRYRATDRVLQMRVAQQLGFSVPTTLITNSPTAAREFCQTHERVIFKGLNRKQNMIGLEFGVAEDVTKTRLLYTTLITPKSLESIDSLQLCPGIFQVCVDKKFELRITVVGNDVFAAEIHSQEHEDTVIDFRRQWYKGIDLQYKAHTLAAEIQEKCIALTRRLSLAYSAIDMIVTPEGEHVFLEINPSGMFGFVEEETGQPISEAIAAMLARGHI